MQNVVITGGTGLIGKAISRALIAKGYHVIVLTRNPEHSPAKKPDADPDPIEYLRWDPAKQDVDSRAIARADYIVNLAGAGIADKRWTQKRKQEITDSRVEGSQLICKSLLEISNKVRAVISASAIGWYGPDQAAHAAFVETDPPHGDFLGNTCRLWEDAIQPVEMIGHRLVILRTGIVLSEKGGALVEFIKTLKFGVAPTLGNGKQITSWIHIDDLVRMYIYAIENENRHGIYNAVAGHVTSKNLVRTLAKERNKFFIPVKAPAFVLKSILGEMSIEVLKSATVSNEKIRESGFTFQHDSIQDALKDLISR